MSSRHLRGSLGCGPQTGLSGFQVKALHIPKETVVDCGLRMVTLGVPSIVLTTLTARYPHSAFGLRYLLANMGPLRDRTALMEFPLGIRERDAAEQILKENPSIVGLSVYIWNVRSLTIVARLLKSLRPDLTLVIGGPEVSYEWHDTEIFAVSDYLIRGEGDLEFSALCRQILEGGPPEGKVREGGLPPLSDLVSPYPEYSDEDLANHRIVYVEASRGCPFRCHFCLSSLDRSVRSFPLEAFLAEMETLLARGVRQLKFVDRTFNLKAETAERILSFFLERYQEGMFLHFEMIPDRLPASLRPLIQAFPTGSLQFEIGIQSFNPEVCERIGRRQDFQALEENLTFLAQHSGVHVHADLIAGLPGETMESFGAGFDRLWRLRPSEIQVGILKRLKGTPITLAGPEWGMLYASEAPYEVLRTAHLTFADLQRLQRFSRYWDLVANSGRFPELLGKLLTDSPFHNFLTFADWLYEQVGATHGIAAKRLENLLQQYLGEADRPDSSPPQFPAASAPRLPKRQRRRLQAG